MTGWGYKVSGSWQSLRCLRKLREGRALSLHQAKLAGIAGAAPAAASKLVEQTSWV
jgi:hypothetical protein